MSSKGAHEQTFESVGMRKTGPALLMCVPAGAAFPAKETKEDHAMDRNSSCVYKTSEGALFAPLFVCAAHFFIFSVRHFCVGVASSPHLQFFSGGGI